MAKKKKKTLKEYFTKRSIFSLLLPLFLSSIFCVLFIRDVEGLQMYSILIGLVAIIFQVATNKASLSHTIYTLVGFLVLNIILGYILYYVNFEEGGAFVYFNIAYTLTYSIIYGLEESIKRGKHWFIIVVLLISGLLMFFAVSYWETHRPRGWYKPIIYVYPEKNMNVEIKVSNPEKLTVTYPKYEDGWKVKALIDGTLIDNNKKYYALYWEGIDNKNTGIKQDGFVIKGEDSASFLEEKLEILGLNYKEKNEFIMYWLPRLESKRYNYIRFMTKEEIDQNMKLNINPEPDTLIRIMMEYKGLDKKIKVKEQSLTRVERKGYTVVEWGGTEIKR